MMLGLIALVVEVVGLACDITGATIIVLGIRLSHEEAERIAQSDDSGRFGVGDANPRLAATLHKQSRDAMRGLIFFVLGFLGQAVGAILAYLAK
jgi:hypothetical protein